MITNTATAMSFNAPFTTTSYYNWLFDKDSERMASNSSPPLKVVTPAIAPKESQTMPSRGTDYSSIVNLPADLIRTRESLDIYNMDHSPLSSSSDDVPSILANMHMASGSLYSQDHPSLFLDRSNEMVDYGYPHTTTQTPSNFLPPVSDPKSTAIESSPNKAQIDSSVYTSPENSASSRHVTSTTSITSHVTTPPEYRCASIAASSPPDSYAARSTSNLPTITPEARDGLMRIISQARPQRPDGFEIVPSDPLLSLSSLQHYSNLFFTRFNSSYPLLHQATFDPAGAHSFLLMAVLLLGATYSDKEAHLIAVCLHDIMRPLIHSSKEFGTRPQLWMLQTILLVECFGKSRAGEKQHDMSHLYHGLLIK
jgi:hypothetical protein